HSCGCVRRSGSSEQSPEARVLRRRRGLLAWAKLRQAASPLSEKYCEEVYCLRGRTLCRRVAPPQNKWDGCWFGLAMRQRGRRFAPGSRRRVPTRDPALRTVQVV